VHGETGLLVKPKDVESLANAMEILVSNPELARKMGERGRERALSLYDEKISLARQIEAYKKAAGTLGWLTQD